MQEYSNEDILEIPINLQIDGNIIILDLLQQQLII